MADTSNRPEKKQSPDYLFYSLPEKPRGKLLQAVTYINRIISPDKAAHKRKE